MLHNTSIWGNLVNVRQFDILMSVHRKYISKLLPRRCNISCLFSSTDALQVSGGSSTHHQEHTTVHTASGIVNQYCCLLLPWMRWNWNSISSMVALSSSIGRQYLKLCVQFCAPDDVRRNRLKHGERL